MPWYYLAVPRGVARIIRRSTILALLLVGCTQDFDAFHVVDGRHGASGGTAGSLSDSATTGGLGGVGAGASGGNAGDASAGAPPTGGQAGLSGAAGDGGALAPDAAPDADVPCPAGQKLCGGACVATNQPDFGCAETSCAPCLTPNATPTCSVQGLCALLQCDAGFADCDTSPDNGCESDRQIDLQNCGTCGSPCLLPHATEACVAGQCVITGCQDGWSNCDSVVENGCERATASDPTACGSCARDCRVSEANWTCVAGACQVSLCPPLLGDCDNNTANGCETSLESPQSCGACTNNCQLPGATSACRDGQCAIEACNTGFADCDGLPGNGCEVNLASNANHCGACNAPCSTLNTSAPPSCTLGSCSYLCQSTFADCNGPQPGSSDDGCETNLTTAATCGACGRSCAANQTCTAGQCACLSGFADCDGQAQTGCETNVSTNASQCGACNRSCGANAACNAGSCRCLGSFADCDGNLANGCETDLRTSVSSCGSCGSACSSVNGTATCTDGACSIVCNAGFGNCDGNVGNGCETATSSSASHCGGCGNACSAPSNGSADCANGTCLLTCSAGFGNCDGRLDNGCETDLQTSFGHCGACRAVCSGVNGVALCSAGACSLTCSAGYDDCDNVAANGCEVNLARSLAHCGACGSTCGSQNAIATCASGICNLQCAIGFGDCNGSVSDGCETSTASSTSHCGSCGKVCSAQNGVASCTNGSCNITCDAGFGNCDGSVTNGCETPLDTIDDCGSCDNACSSQGGTPSCNDGQCSGIACDPGFANCDGNVENGCERPLGTLQDCAACNNACNATNGTATCVSRSCTISCNAGFANCDGNLNNGCETSLTSLQNCGSCGNVCTSSSGTASCATGQCVDTCGGNSADCDGNPGNGCETDTRTDAAHCGGCNRPCSAANASSGCLNGACVFTCLSGFSNCDADMTNGCEADTRTNPLHCGSCGNTCDSSNGTAACSGGTCSILCNSGFASCDGDLANGCETNTRTSALHCGSCNSACSSSNGTGVCSGGSCGITCNTFFSNCDANLSNGCETNLATSATHCGFCGNACGSNAACSGGACVCDASRANCDGNQANGCETNLASHAAHCGACGSSCVANAICASSECRCGATGEICAPVGPNQTSATCSATDCVLGCASGFGDCDGLSANGCEANLSSAQSCGGCGNVCVAGAVCSSGVCRCGTTGETCASSGPGYTAASCSGTNCALSCAANFADCDGNPTNGCEVATQTSAAHCGGCNKPCAPNMTCSAGTCACTAGFVDCDGQAANGCEARLSSDVRNCGACGRACGTQNVASRVCSEGQCTSSCASGFANCNQPATGVDDGCERDVRENDASCGGCDNSCTSQNGLVCGQNSTPDGYCGCGGDGNLCRSGAVQSLLVACGAGGFCECARSLTNRETCRAGEVCVADGVVAMCSCNGGAACLGQDQICCQTPPGCVNAKTDPQNCGGCGRACAPGFGCSAGRCVCTTSAQCAAGSPGTCTASGVCVCGGNTCVAGERCQANGTCG